MLTKDVKKKVKISLSRKARSSDTLNSSLGITKMPLPPLKVVGPISTMITSVRVQGQLPGANVVIMSLSDHQVKARGIATCSDQRFEISPNVVLNHDDRLVATQTIGIDVSELPSEYQSVSVQQAPLELSEIGGIKIESFGFFEGENHLWISGCIPGAEVVACFNETVQGRTVSEEGVARLTLTAKLKTGMPISVYQIVKGIGSGPSSSITPERGSAPYSEKRETVAIGLACKLS